MGPERPPGRTESGDNTGPSGSGSIAARLGPLNGLGVGMGDQGVQPSADERLLAQFAEEILRDLEALESLLARGSFESGVRRVGVEQECFLTDSGMRPAALAPHVLERAADPRLTNELGRFHVEANLDPLDFAGSCLGTLHQELGAVLQKTQEAAQEHGASVVLTGILPTLRRSDCGTTDMTPGPRYALLDRQLRQNRGGPFQVRINGVDDLEVCSDTFMIEAPNASFQVHLQVDPTSVAVAYNAAQLASAPVLAAAVNSPLLFGKRLWHESRIALFRDAVDERSMSLRARGAPPRVSFGRDWLRGSAGDYFADQVATHRSLLRKDVTENPYAAIAQGRAPRLQALTLHTGTVWPWNRLCYGVWQGRPTLRIESRVLPSGPSVVDEVANAAFLLGLMVALPEELRDPGRTMPFSEVQENFLKASRYGLDSQLRWTDGRVWPSAALITQVLLPLARAGLEYQGCNGDDIDRYLGVVEQRVLQGRTGAQWSLDYLATTAISDQLGGLTRYMRDQQELDRPVHDWAAPRDSGRADAAPDARTVEDALETTYYYARPLDPLQLVRWLMERSGLQYLPVEDTDGRLLGLIRREALASAPETACAGELASDATAITIHSEMQLQEARERMRNQRIDLLLVVDDGHLAGVLRD